MVFPVVMHRCESWTIKKAEYQRTDVFKLWCWRRLLRVLWTARRSNQSILKEINPESSLEGLMLKCQYLGHLMWPGYSLEKTLMLGKIEGRRRGRQRMRRLDGITDSTDMNLGKLQEMGRDRRARQLQSLGHEEWDTTWWLSNSTSTTSVGQSESEPKVWGKQMPNLGEEVQVVFHSTPRQGEVETCVLFWFFFQFSKNTLLPK